MKKCLSHLVKTTFILLWKAYHKSKYQIKVWYYRFQIKLNKETVINKITLQQDIIDSTKKKAADLLQERASGIKSEYSSVSEIPFIRKTHAGEVIWMNRSQRRKLLKK